jgi:hypothetical protein
MRWDREWTHELHTYHDWLSCMFMTWGVISVCHRLLSFFVLSYKLLLVSVCVHVVRSDFCSIVSTHTHTHTHIHTHIYKYAILLPPFVCCWQFHCNTCAASFWWIDQNKKSAISNKLETSELASSTSQPAIDCVFLGFRV